MQTQNIDKFIHHSLFVEINNRLKYTLFSKKMGIFL